MRGTDRQPLVGTHQTADHRTVGFDSVGTTLTLNEEFRTACARAKCDEPWIGGLPLDVGPNAREYPIGLDERPDLRVRTWQHPYARAFFEGSPGGRFTLDRDEAAGFAAVDGESEESFSGGCRGS